jgi:hypothetical protein
MRIIDRFGLLRWAGIGYEDSPISTLDSPSPLNTEDSSKLTVMLAEEMLHILIILLAERYVPGVSVACTPTDFLQNIVIQLLCTGPKPFSSLERV